nr:OmpA family protein [Pedobacter sp. SYSU D00823]
MLLLVLGLIVVTKASAQDARVSQYRAIPLLVNPAQTGDIEEGNARITGLFARISNRQDYNHFYNLSADMRLGKKGMWGVGLNYLQTGSPNIPISGKYAGISAARQFYIDKYKFQELRVGFQASYLYGTVDEAKGPYDRLIDVRPVRWFTPANATGNFKGSLGYMNYSTGLKYKLTLDRLKIESGFSAYNITNPDYNLMYKNMGWLLKRYRVNALSSIYYRPDPKNALKVEHYSWKEGIYLRDYKAKRDDSTEIHETTYSLTYYRYMPKKTVNIGMYSRSWKAVYGMLGMNINDKVGFHVSYEMPILKPYYDVSHVEVSLSIFPYGWRKKKPADMEKYTQENNRKLISQMEALLPFGTTFCLPCGGNNLANIKTVPDAPKSPDKNPCDSVVAATLAAVPERSYPDTSMAVSLDSRLSKRFRVFYKDTIYYDFDKYYIRPSAAFTLNKISNIMKNDSSLTLQIKSHTDLRGSIAYNKILSQNRAKSAKNYLKNSGIDTQRIATSWYGEKAPINNCEGCKDIVQQKNRRSELYLSGFKEQELGETTFGSDTVSQEELLGRINTFMKLDADTSNSARSSNTNYFTIYLGSSANVGDGNISYLKGLNANVFERKDDRGHSLYFFGVFNDEKLAEDRLRRIKALGLRNAYLKKIQMP